MNVKIEIPFGIEA